MRFVFLFVSAIGLYAQVPCKVSLVNSANMRGMYGGKTAVFQSQVECLNTGLAPVAITGVGIDMSMQTINTIPSATAQALLTKTFNNQRGQQISRDATVGIGILGALQAGGKAFIASTPFGYIVMLYSLFQSYILPLFTANEIPLNFNNPCDQVQAGTMISPGGSIVCWVSIQKPAKGATPLPGAFTFNLLTSGSTFPVPPPLPPPTPVQLKHGALHINPDAAIEPMNHTDYARKLYFDGDWANSVSEYNLAVKDALAANDTKEAKALLAESTGSLYHDGPTGPAMADYVLARLQENQ